jgi:GTPase SAR1 family protein
MASNNFTTGLLRNEHAELLDVTDQLRDLGLGHHLPLPQLVVCGDQSSGKSSVLESISGVKFPVSDGICTRFAIHLVLRRSISNQRSVKIEPGKSSSDQQKLKFQAFNDARECSEDLPEIIERAKKIMELGKNGTFSDARLRIEVSGPDQPHLTLVDLPGLIHCPDSSQTNSDVDTVERLVNEYMREERTIILAVVSANNQAGLQKVLKMAKLNDQRGCRTMGIITKPDTLPSGSEMERKYLRYARNQEAPLALGWHVVRNANFEECKDQTYDRRRKELDLFSRDPWKDLPRSSLGADALVTRLSKCSFELTRSELPKVLQEIQSHIADYRNRLQQLGTSRTSVEAQRQYLTRIAETFQLAVLDGVAGQFGRENHYSVPPRRLRSEYRRLTDEFADDIRQQGRYYEPTQPAEYQEYLEMINNDILKVNRGLELPTTFDPLLVRELFRKQSQNWEQFALQYADKMFFTAKDFVVLLLQCTMDSSTYGTLVEKVIEPAMSQKQEALHDRVTELLTPYTRSHPFSKRPGFIKELEKIESAYKPYPASDNAEHAAAMYSCRKLADWERAYYDTALETFIDNMATLAVENCVLADLHKIFSPSYVAALDDQTLHRLASESAETIDTRNYLNQTLEKFERALRICGNCGSLTTAVAGDGLPNPRVISSPAVSAAARSPEPEGLATMLSGVHLSAPKIRVNNSADAEENNQDRPGSSASRTSDTTTQSGTRSRTGAPSPAHSPSTSLFSVRSASSTSSPASSPGSRDKNRRQSQLQTKSESEVEEEL